MGKFIANVFEPTEHFLRRGNVAFSSMEIFAIFPQAMLCVCQRTVSCALQDIIGLLLAKEFAIFYFQLQSCNSHILNAVPREKLRYTAAALMTLPILQLQVKKNTPVIVHQSNVTLAMLSGVKVC